MSLANPSWYRFSRGFAYHHRRRLQFAEVKDFPELRRKITIALKRELINRVIKKDACSTAISRLGGMLEGNKHLVAIDWFRFQMECATRPIFRKAKVRDPFEVFRPTDHLPIIGLASISEHPVDLPMESPPS